MWKPHTFCMQSLIIKSQHNIIELETGPDWRQGGDTSISQDPVSTNHAWPCLPAATATAVRPRTAAATAVTAGLDTNGFFFMFPPCKKSFICLVDKSMTPRRGNTILFCSSQQLHCLCLGALKGFLSWDATLQGPSSCLVRCLQNYRESRKPTGMLC